MLVDRRLQRICFDDLARIKGVRAVHPCVRGDEYQRVKLWRECESELRRHFDFAEGILEDGDMAFVLCQRGSHALVVLGKVVPSQELAILRDFETAVKALGFENEDIEEAVDE
ncbi:hypothetical protein D3C87_1653670 [compost metagenome]